MALSWAPRPGAAGVEAGAADDDAGILVEVVATLVPRMEADGEDDRKEADEGVGACRLSDTSMRSAAKSSLLPTSSVVKLGEASARASFKKGCRPSKDRCAVTS